MKYLEKKKKRKVHTLSGNIPGEEGTGEEVKEAVQEGRPDSVKPGRTRSLRT